MKKELKEKIVWKHESTRDIIRDVVACIIIAYVATLAFLLVDSRVKFVDAQTDYISSQIHVQHAAAPMVMD